MNYIKKNCELLEKNLEEYIKGLNSNYVVMENDTPLTWESDGTPAIFGGKEDAEECIENFKIANTRESIYKYPNYDNYIRTNKIYEELKKANQIQEIK